MRQDILWCVRNRIVRWLYTAAAYHHQKLIELTKESEEDKRIRKLFGHDN